MTSSLSEALPSEDAVGEGAEVMVEGYAVQAMTMSGNCRTVHGMLPSTTLQELAARAAEELSLPHDGIELCLGVRKFTSAEMQMTLAEAGVHPDAELMCIAQVREAWFFNPDMLRMQACLPNEDLAQAAVASACRAPLLTRSVEMATAAAEAREAARKTAESESPAKEHGYFDEGKHSQAIYESRRRTVEFAEAAAEARAAFSRAAAARAAAARPQGDFRAVAESLDDYDARRRTVDFAIRAAAEREARLEALCTPVR